MALLQYLKRNDIPKVSLHQSWICYHSASFSKWTPIYKKCRRRSLSPPWSKSLKYWWLSLTVAVIVTVCKNSEQQLKFFWACVLPPNFTSLLPLHASIFTGVQKSFDTWFLWMPRLSTTYVHVSRGVSASLPTTAVGQHAHIKIGPERQF